MKKLSIIIPIYMTDICKLNRCLNSISPLSNAYDYEILLINDGNPNEYTNQLHSLENEMICVIDKPNSGVSETRNLGIEKASGEFIMFVDADDEIISEFITEAIDLISKENCDIVIGGLYYKYKNTLILRTIDDNIKYYTNPDKILSRILMNENPSNELNNHCLGAVYGRIYKSSIIHNIKFNKEIFKYEDILFNIQTIIKAKKIAITKQPAYYYYQYKNSSIRKKSNLVYKNHVLLLDELSTIINNKSWQIYVLRFALFLYKDALLNLIYSRHSKGSVKAFIKFTKDIIQNKIWKEKRLRPMVNLYEKIVIYLAQKKATYLTILFTTCIITINKCIKCLTKKSDNHEFFE